MALPAFPERRWSRAFSRIFSSWRAAFIVPGAVCLATGVWFALRLLAGKVVMERRSYRQDRAQPSAHEARRGLFMLLGSILFTGLMFQMMSVVMPKLFQARLGDVIGTGALAAGTLVSVVYAISALGQYMGGVLADRHDERWIYPVSYGMQVLVLMAARRHPEPVAGRDRGACGHPADRHRDRRELPDRALHARRPGGRRSMA